VTLLARYKELRETLAEEIATGIHPVGGKFPTEYELCDRFSVSRHTVREALRALQDRGMLSRQAGSGTVVLDRTANPLYSQTAKSLAELFDYATDTRFEKRHEGIVHLRQSLADLLGCGVGERWLHFAGIRWLVGEPRAVCWTEIFVAEPYFAIREDGEDERPVYDRIQRRFGLETEEVEQRISATAMAPDVAALLGAAPHSPALLTRRRYFARNATPFEISLSVHPADRYASTQRLRRDERAQTS
jgi:GntR family transcriptional regulator